MHILHSLFVIEQSKKLNVTTPSITFDQPLWLKALEIITAKKMDIVPLLGGFHMLMSFYGSIGTIMARSGIDKLFQSIYGENSVTYMLSGKALARTNSTHSYRKCTIDKALTNSVIRTCRQYKDCQFGSYSKVV